MTPEQWQHVERAFDEAVDLDPPTQARFVTDFRSQHPELADKLQRLLDADEAKVDLAAPVAAGVAALKNESDDAWVGKTLGAWTIIKRIAAGGMGAVFLAERADEQFQQQAAIKIMTAQMLADDAMTRFRAERQILASLDHRFIARLLDGGSTDTRLPYLVMEFVDGVPVDAYCDERRLGVNERLRVFLDICEAVGYAHRNLIVHRDLKPNNILVNADGEPRLLDFGIAKLLEGGVDMGTMAVTRQGMQVMTPEYASPEQVRGHKITVATDIYALGVLLYHILSGHHPYAGQLGTSVGAEKAICHVDPKPPSAATRASTKTISSDDVASTRRTTGPRLRRALRGDIDNIVLKAMRKEPDLRYESVRQFADDIERFLNNEPVRAHPPQLGYRVNKFLRRHAMPVAATALAAILFIGTITFYTLRVTSERDRAQLEAAKASQVSSFVTDLFRTANPDESLGEIITARALLDQGVRRLDQLDSQPEVQAAMQDVIGAAYQGLGLYDTAQPLLEQSGMTRARLLGDDHPDTFASRRRLGEVLTSRGQNENAEALFRGEADRLQRVAPGSAPHGRALSGLALALSTQSKFDEAGTHFAAALDILEAHPDEAEPLASLLDDYGRYLSDVGETERAIPMLRRAIAMFKEARGEGHPSYLNAMQNLGYTLMWVGKLDEADTVFGDMLTLSNEVYGTDHPFSVGAVATLATVHYERSNYAQAEVMYRDVLGRFEAIFGENHPESSIGANNLATALQKLGRYREAEKYYRIGLERNLLIHGDKHIEVATSYSNLGVFLTREGNLAEAEGPILKGLEIRTELLGPDHPNTLTSVSIYASFLRQIGAYDRALELSRQVLDGRRGKLGPDHPLTARERGRYAILLRESGQVDEALSQAKNALDTIRAAYPDSHEEAADIELEFARTLAAAQRHAEAQASFDAALAEYRSAIGRDHPRYSRGLLAYAEFLLEQGRADEAQTALVEARGIRAKAFAADDWRLAAVDNLLGETLIQQGKCAAGQQQLVDSHATLLAVRGDAHPLTRAAAKRLNLLCATDSQAGR